MSDIKEGDWVQITYPMKCCGCLERTGHVYQVEFIDPPELPDDMEPYTCTTCGDDCIEPVAGFFGGYDFGEPIYRLKKIPPLSDDESIETSNDLDIPVKVVA